MPYSISTKDGITINNIPDDIAPDSDILRQRVASLRAERDGEAPQAIEQAPQQAPQNLALTDLQKTVRGITQNEQQINQASQVADTEQFPDNRFNTRAVKELPELGRGGLLSSEDQIKVAALSPVLLATTNPQEIADILTSNFPNIGISQDSGGNLIAANNETGVQSVINKPGLSQIDLLQGLGIAAAFTPAVGGATGLAAPTLAKLAGKSAATQAGIEGAQALSGGEFEAAPIAIAAGAAPVGQALAEKVITPAVKSISNKLFNYSNPTKAQQRILTELEKNPRNPDLAKFEVVAGKPKATARLKEAVKQFGSPETVTVIKASSAADKKAIKRMIDIVKSGKKDPLFADRVRVGDVVGKSLSNRIKGTKSLLNNAGREIDKIARNDLKGNSVNVSQAKKEFTDALADLRVSRNESTGELGFGGSALEGSGGGQARDLVKNISSRLKSDNVDAADIHFAKRLIDQKTAFGTSESGLSGEIERAIKGVRFNLNKSLRDNFPKYGKANEKYSDAIGAIEQIQSAAGSKLNLDSAEALGVKARGFTSNTQGRARLIESLDNMQTVLQKHGIKFKDDILTQINIANALEERFKTQGSTTFRNEIAKAGADVIDKGITRTAIDKVSDSVGKINGVSDDKALNALLKIIED